MGAADIHLDNLWLPFTPNKDFHQSPRVFTGANGMYFTTADGGKVLDGVSSLWCVGAGHNRREINDAIYKQLQTLDYSTAFQFSNDRAFEAAHMIAELAPGDLNKVFFCTSGSEAADTSMKMEAMTTFIKDMPEVKKVFLLNQNYSHGQQVVKYAKENLSRKRPDIQIVGEDLHPLAQVRDFAPYIAKIKASGADTVITGNWGSDLALLVKAANEGGYNGKFFTYYAGVTGTPTALGQGGAGRVYQIAYAHYNMGGRMGQYGAGFKAKYNDDMYTGSMIGIFDLLTQAMAKAGSTDPVKVAAAMHGHKFKGYNGEMEMRKLDHQMQQTLFMTVWQKADKKFPYSAENTGMTLAPVKTFEPYVSSTPTSCQMKMPS